MGRSRGGLTTKIHALVDACGSPIVLQLSEGQAYGKRNLIERFFNKLKQFRAIATRYDKRDDNYLANSPQHEFGCALMRRWL